MSDIAASLPLKNSNHLQRPEKTLHRLGSSASQDFLHQGIVQGSFHPILGRQKLWRGETGCFRDIKKDEKNWKQKQAKMWLAGAPKKGVFITHRIHVCYASGQMAQDTLAVAEMVPLKGRGKSALQSWTRTPRFHPCSRADCGRDDIWSLSMKWNFHRSRFPPN